MSDLEQRNHVWRPLSGGANVVLQRMDDLPLPINDPIFAWAYLPCVGPSTVSMLRLIHDMVKRDPLVVVDWDELAFMMGMGALESSGSMRPNHPLIKCLFRALRAIASFNTYEHVLLVPEHLDWPSPRQQSKWTSTTRTVIVEWTRQHGIPTPGEESHGAHQLPGRSAA